jgi:amidohydrolase
VRGVGGTGVLARVNGAAPGRTVLVRADIDAYPVADAKDVEYRSRNLGVTHACGHDVHTAVAVGVLRHFAEHRPASGSVTVIFQPAEEIPFGAVSGAATVLANEALRGMRADAVLGLHCWPQLEAGQLGLDGGIAMAAKDAFEITVTGRSVHAATPASGRDAILAAATLVGALHNAVGRRRDPQERVAFNVGTIAGGTSQSALAGEVVLTGTLRTHDESVRQRLRSVIAAAVDGSAAQFDLTASLQWANEMPAVVNDAGLVEMAAASLATVASVVRLESAPMTTDDFALYSSLGPTLYLKLGVAPPGRAPSAPLHSNMFDVDESCIAVGVRSMVQLCHDVLTCSTGGDDRR